MKNHARNQILLVFKALFLKLMSYEWEELSD